MLHSLRSRLVLSNLLISLSGLLIVVVVFLFALTDRMTSVRATDRRAQVQSVAQQVHRVYLEPAKQSRADLRSLVFTSSRVLRARIVIYSPLGVRIVDSKEKTPYYTGTWTLLDPNAFEQEENAEKQIRGSGLVRFQAPIKGVHRSNGGAVLLVVPSPDVRPTLQSLTGIILVIAGTALLVWILIGLYFTSSISRPLLRITEATEEMARGNYGVRVTIPGRGEIARLGGSFNSMAEQVQRANQVLRDFVANVSHDLRTPLTMISGFSQALLDGTARYEEIESSAEIIHEEATKMQRLVEDLLQLTRLESGLFTLDRRPLEVQSFVQRLLDRVRRIAGDRPVPRLENNVPLDLPPAEVDAVQFERALRNLLDNAIQYTPADGTIRVSARTVGRDQIEIVVRDTGAGIAPDQLPRIFERFYRTDKSRDRGHGHSGLGLAIVREIVEAHGGRVSAESSPGEGTVFTLTVPRSHESDVRQIEREEVAT